MCLIYKGKNKSECKKFDIPFLHWLILNSSVKELYNFFATLVNLEQKPGMI